MSRDDIGVYGERVDCSCIERRRAALAPGMRITSSSVMLISPPECLQCLRPPTALVRVRRRLSLARVITITKLIPTVTKTANPPAAIPAVAWTLN